MSQYSCMVLPVAERLTPWKEKELMLVSFRSSLIICSMSLRRKGIKIQVFNSASKSDL